MDAGRLDIDDFVDYRAEYRDAIKGAKDRDGSLVGRCPFHDDQKDSFSADLKTGKWNCFAEGIKGNFLTFWAKYYNHNDDTKEAYRQILKKYGRLDGPAPKKGRTAASKNKGYTLAEYAAEKRLPEDFLKDTCGIGTAKDRDGTQHLKMPYFSEEGTKPILRKRYGGKGFLWGNGAGGRLILYGDWRLPEVRKTGWAALVEGESDTQTLWHLNISALGVPGASNFNARMAAKLQGLKVYIHQEPDQGGQAFLAKVCRILGEEGFTGEACAWSCSQFGVKDPSELYLKEGAEGASKKILMAIKHARRIDLGNLSDTIPEAIKGAPVNLRQPGGWVYSEKGISRIEEKKAVPTMVCRTPVILTRRLKGMETGEEKIEVAFKRDGQWIRAIYPRSAIFTAKGITALADLGCTVTSENARQVVRFLAALEAENIDVIPKAESTSTFGWQPGGRFLPWHGGDVVLDIEPSLRGWAAAYRCNGTFREWRQLMEPHRGRDKFRFLLAAGFAAPLLRIVRQRNFLVYNWANSRGGKTAALKAALSAWGDPEKLMVSFDATKVALERMAGFFSDLPLGVDERQLAGKQQDYIEQICYMLANGTGRARGSKGGGLQLLNTWRTVALATGEEPLRADTTQAGVDTRVLEIYGRPFEDEDSASLMHQKAPMHCGWAGAEFMRRVLQTDEASIRERYGEMAKAVQEAGASGAHVAAISLVALADAIIDTWIFGDKTGERQNGAGQNGGFREQNEASAEQGSGSCKKPLEIWDSSWGRAVQMGQGIIREQLAESIPNANENAAQFMADWILSNRNQFGTLATGVCLGFINKNEGKAYVYPSLFKKALEKEGYNHHQVMKYLADENIIASKPQKGGRVYSVTKWFDGRKPRFIEFDLSRFSGSGDAQGNGAWEGTADPEPHGWEQLSIHDSIPFHDPGGE